MISVTLTMDDNNVQTRIKGKMHVRDAIQLTSGFCGAMIEVLKDAGMSEDEAQYIIAQTALSATDFYEEVNKNEK